MTASPRIDLTGLGWDAAWAAQVAPFAGTPGRVARVDRGVCTVLAETGPVRAGLGADLLAAVARDSTNAPCTGDWVAVREWPDGRATVDAVLPRRTSFVRAEASERSRGQVLAANMTVVAVVAGLDALPVLTRIERLLALAWASGADPAVLLTKADRAADAEDVASDVRKNAPGVQVICCSAVTGQGLIALEELIGSSGTVALLGSSGTGKSSLTNALAGAEVLSTQAIRADGRGRHTSVRRELVLLPGGGAVIDTPGLRGVGLVDAGQGLAATFADIAELAAGCRFSDCGHESEPGCAVLEAVDGGLLAQRRLLSWRKLCREQAWIAARSDERLRGQQVKVAKLRTRSARQAAQRRS